MCATGSDSGHVLHASCMLKASQRVNTGTAPLAKQPVGKPGARDGTNWRLELEQRPMSSWARHTDERGGNRPEQPAPLDEPPFLPQGPDKINM